MTQYKKLSEQVQQLSNPQRSDTFVKMFREEVRQGKIQAIYLPGQRFTMPKEYSRRGSDGTYQRETKEMLFEASPAFEKWFDGVNRDLAAARRGGRIKPSVEAVQAGLVDFGALAKETRQKMQANFEKGQALGKTRTRTPRKRK
ncbi:hypothetical protein ACFP81_06725 [Deinococcus lacus]|uniref:Uncharacterized protein n=1 Tax=Deinococcus lacus TaxID=392561 RepID=A0ABW1YEP9_9DEIO